MVDDLVVEHDPEHKSGCGTLDDFSSFWNRSFVAADHNGGLLLLFPGGHCARLFPRSASDLPASSYVQSSVTISVRAERIVSSNSDGQIWSISGV